MLETMLETNEYIRLANMLRESEYIRLANMLREVAKSIDDMGDSYVSGILFSARVLGKLGGEVDEVEG